MKNVNRPDVWKAASLILRPKNNSTLTKLVIRDTNGDPKDAKVFWDLWTAAANANQISVLDVGGNKMPLDACQSMADALEVRKEKKGKNESENEMNENEMRIK